MLMSNLTHRLIACKAHFEYMKIENVLYKFITITITASCFYQQCLWHMKIVCLFKYVRHCQLCYQIHFFCCCCCISVEVCNSLGKFGLHLKSKSCCSLVSSKDHVCASGWWILSSVMLFVIVVRHRKSKGKVIRLWLVKTSGSCRKWSFIISSTLDSSWSLGWMYWWVILGG